MTNVAVGFYLNVRFCSFPFLILITESHSLFLYLLLGSHI